MSLHKKSSVIIQRCTYYLLRVTPDKKKTFTIAGTLEKSFLFFQKVNSCTEPLRSKKVYQVQQKQGEKDFFISFSGSPIQFDLISGYFLVIISAAGNLWDRNVIPLNLQGELVFPRNVTVVTIALLISVRQQQVKIQSSTSVQLETELNPNCDYALVKPERFHFIGPLVSSLDFVYRIKKFRRNFTESDMTPGWSTVDHDLVSSCPE